MWSLIAIYIKGIPWQLDQRVTFTLSDMLCDFSLYSSNRKRYTVFVRFFW